jgi:cytoskeleton protein RodZ
MSEVAEAPAAGQVSAGTLLRRAREAAGLHVAAVAVALKVPVRKLEALEDDRYDDMGDAVFIRALASSVCRTLKTDPQPVLERLPQTAAPRLLKDNQGLNAPFRAPSDAAPPGWRDALRQPVPLAVIALLLAALLIYVLPIRHGEDTPVASTSAAPSVVATQQPAPSAVTDPAPAAQVAANVETPPSPSATQANAPGAAEESATPTPQAPAPAASAAAPAPASGIVVIRTKGESWVEVVDAKGTVGLRKLMQAGESAGASGALPLKVTIGKVDMTEVQVRGKPFDLKRVSQDNVARFEVK